MFDAADPSPEYELAWPRDLFVTEATALLEPSNPTWLEDVELLLEEAFTGTAPKDDLRTAKWYELPPGLFKNAPAAGAPEVARAFVAHLVNSADKLPERSKRRPYWSVRSTARAASLPTAVQDRLQQLQREWTQLVDDLQREPRNRCQLGCTADSSAMVRLFAEATLSHRWNIHYHQSRISAPASSKPASGLNPSTAWAIH